MLNLSSLQQFIAKGGTPKALLEQTSLMNPMLNGLITAIKSGNSQNVETFARNICREQGRDFDKEFAEFKKQFNK